MRLSIIIPTLKEEANLEATLNALRACSNGDDDHLEIVIADAGSEDGTLAIAEKFDCIILNDLERSRSK